jgi:hypothetical protein
MDYQQQGQKKKRKQRQPKLQQTSSSSSKKRKIGDKSRQNQKVSMMETTLKGWNQTMMKWVDFLNGTKPFDDDGMHIQNYQKRFPQSAKLAKKRYAKKLLNIIYYELECCFELRDTDKFFTVFLHYFMNEFLYAIVCEFAEECKEFNIIKELFELDIQQKDRNDDEDDYFSLRNYIYTCLDDIFLNKNEKKKYEDETIEKIYLNLLFLFLSPPFRNDFKSYRVEKKISTYSWNHELIIPFKSIYEENDCLKQQEKKGFLQQPQQQ